MKVKKSVKALRAEDYAAKAVISEQSEILGIEEKDTEYGHRQIMRLKDGPKEYAIFVNTTSMDNLIDAYGDETESWTGRLVKVICERGKGKNKSNMLVVYGLQATKI